MEWALARFCQIVPCNWGLKSFMNFIPSCCPLGFLVADGQNVIVREFLNSDCLWLFLVEQDNILPPDAFIRLNDYIKSEKIPIVSGLYFTKSVPAEPILYRGRSNSYYDDWVFGDKVWVDGVPTGCLLIHRRIIEVLWSESQEYNVNGQKTRRVFAQPARVWFDPESGKSDTAQGTSDLEFCARIILENVLVKAGWPKLQEKEYPYLVDTNLFCGHIDDSGRVYPFEPDRQKYRTPKIKRRFP